MNELALFAGAGGGILGGHLLGWRTVCAVEWEPYPASVLCARQNDGLLPPFPIWDDVQTFDGKPWKGIVDVVSGGFPCQDISIAGKGDGLEGQRSGMWREMGRIISEVRPRCVFVENSPMLTSRGLDRVLGDLSEMGFDAKWGVMGADSVGANHKRDRIWIVAHAKRLGWKERAKERGEFKKQETSNQFNNCGSDQRKNQMAITQSKRLERWNIGRLDEQTKPRFREGSWSVETNWFFEPDVGRVANGVAARVDRLKAIGNGQVPLCAATAWRILNEL
jgi:DNA (cytosine-5)-methyltransferase 1